MTSMLVAGGAQASGFALIEQNASGLGNAYSGQGAAAENASTIFFNPAGMTLLPGRQVSGSLEFVQPSAKFTNSGASRNGLGAFAPAGGDNGGDAGGVSGIPNAYVSWQLTDSLWAGVGVSVPFGLKTEYDASFIGRFQSQHSEVKTIDINPSLAWKVTDWLSLGGGFSIQQGSITINRSIPIGGVERYANIQVSDTGWGWNVGAMLMPAVNTRIGLSYRSTIKYNMDGQFSSNSPLNPVGDVALSIKVPDTWSLSGSQRFGDVQLLADYTYTKWDVVQSPQLIAQTPVLATPPGGAVSTFNLLFRNTYRAGLGLNYDLNQAWMLKAGVAYDKSPVTDATRTTFLPDNNRTWLSVGAKYRPSKDLTFDVGYAHLFVSDGNINNLQLATGGGNVVGSYKSYVNILGGQVTYRF
ncbi:MAG: OmpP1/FadL family transporter [Burkholderiales bacterium]